MEEPSVILRAMNTSKFELKAYQNSLPCQQDKKNKINCTKLERNKKLLEMEEPSVILRAMSTSKFELKAYQNSLPCQQDKKNKIDFFSEKDLIHYLSGGKQKGLRSILATFELKSFYDNKSQLSFKQLSKETNLSVRQVIRNVKKLENIFINGKSLIESERYIIAPLRNKTNVYQLNDIFKDYYFHTSLIGLPEFSHHKKYKNPVLIDPAALSVFQSEMEKLDLSSKEAPNLHYGEYVTLYNNICNLYISNSYNNNKVYKGYDALSETRTLFKNIKIKNGKESESLIEEIEKLALKTKTIPIKSVIRYKGGSPMDNNENVSNVLGNLLSKIKIVDKPKETKVKEIKPKLYYKRNDISFINSLTLVGSSLELDQKGDEYSKRLRILTNGDADLKSILNPKLVSRYKSFEDLNTKLNIKLIELEILDKNDKIFIYPNGDYSVYSNREVSNLSSHLDPSFFGILLLLAIPDKYLNMAFSISYQRNKNFDFIYFFKILGAVLFEKLSNLPNAKLKLKNRYNELLNILIDCRANTQSLCASKYIAFRPGIYDFDFLCEYAQEKKKENTEIYKQRIDEKKNEQYASKLLKFEQIPYNPHISRDERAGFKVEKAEEYTKSKVEPYVSKIVTDQTQENFNTNENVLKFLDQFKDKFIKKE